MKNLIAKANELEISLNSLKAEYQDLVKATKFHSTCYQRQLKREMEADMKSLSLRLDSAEWDIALAQYYGVAL